MKSQWIRLVSLILCLSMLLSTGAAAYAVEPENVSETTASETVAEPTAETVTQETTAETEPEETVPETTAETEPEETVPETTAETEPEETVPETTAEMEPEETVPETTAEMEPEETVPETTAETEPEETVPETIAETEPEETNPETTTETEPEATEELSKEAEAYEADEADEADEVIPVTVTYTYDNDPLGRTGEATIYFYGEDYPVAYSDDEFTTQAEASAYIRSQMKRRIGEITLTYTSDTALDFDTVKNTMIKELLNAAFAHTGVPTEGDYLYRQWEHWSALLSCSSYSMTCTYTITYYTTAAQELEVDEAVSSVLASLNVWDAPDDQKVKEIYDYICANVSYDYTNLNNDSYKLKYTAYAALINKTAVCQGFAVLFYRMLLTVGVDCRVIVGTSSGGNHAWNIVRLDDLYYNADTTWDAGSTSYSYYLRCPANFSNHTRNSEYDTTSFHTAYPMSSVNRGYCSLHFLKYVSAKAATCTASGNNAYYVCSDCGKYFEDWLGTKMTTLTAVTLVGEHTLEKTEAVSATCTEAGNNAYYSCTVCGKCFKDEAGKTETTAEDEILSVVGHTLTRVEAVLPTCTKAGNNAYYSCTVCRKCFKDEAGENETTVEAETLAASHTLTLTEAISATCTEAGNNAYYSCTVCGKCFKDEAGETETTAEDEMITATGHKINLVAASESTCTETGNNAYYSCSVCGKCFTDEAGTQETTLEAVTIPTVSHTLEKTEAVSATCTTGGNNVYYVCSVCGKYFKDEAGAQETSAEDENFGALGHTMTKTEAVSATCTAGGNNAYYFCSVCEKYFVDEAGTQETTPEAETLAATGHAITPVAVSEPTCTQVGSKGYYTCTICEKCYTDAAGIQETTLEAVTTPATGHDMTKKEAVTVTCTEGGNVAYYICSACGKYYRDEAGMQETTLKDVTLEAMGHAMIPIAASAPTCTQTGNNGYYVCYNCGEYFKDEAGTQPTTLEAETLLATGHAMTKVEATAATCIKTGNNEYYTCSNCGKYFKDQAGTQETTLGAEAIAMLAHSYSNGKCTVCGASEKAPTIAITRLFNPNTGEHLLASSNEEISILTGAGWSVDGIMCYMPTSGTPIYRLYNPYSGEHLYTMVISEISNLISLGWTVDGIIAYSATSGGTPIYRLYNANAPGISSHLLSTSQEEMNNLVASGGWAIEGIALYAA